MFGLSGGTLLIIAAACAAVFAAMAAVVFGTGLAARLPFAANTAKFQRSVSLAVKSLWLHKLRSVLSVLGIIIGTCSVIALMSFGEGSMQDALDDISRQGATNIIVRKRQAARRLRDRVERVRHQLRAGARRPGAVQHARDRRHGVADRAHAGVPQ